MAWSNLLANQMVSFLDASTSGFALQSGQSHFTTLPAANQCMTKSEVFAKYVITTTVDTNSISSNQLLRKSYWTMTYSYYIIDGSSIPGENATCSNYSTPVTVYSTSSSMTMPMALSWNSTLTIPYNGNGYTHYYPANNQLITIGIEGDVIAISNCVGDTMPPTTPTSFLADLITQTSAAMEWVASTDNVGVTNYLMYKNGVLLATLGNVTTYTATGLTAGTTYTFAVRARDAAGNLSPEATTSVTTTSAGDTIAPTAPTTFTVTKSGQTSTSTWSGATDNIAVTVYELWRSVGGNQNYIIKTMTSASTFNDVGLTSGEEYYYKVRSKDAAGNNSPFTAEKYVMIL